MFQGVSSGIGNKITVVVFDGPGQYGVALISTVPDLDPAISSVYAFPSASVMSELSVKYSPPSGPAVISKSIVRPGVIGSVVAVIVDLDSSSAGMPVGPAVTIRLSMYIGAITGVTETASTERTIVSTAKLLITFPFLSFSLPFTFAFSAISLLFFLLFFIFYPLIASPILKMKRGL
ncbi:hypothetical protein KAW18_09995 [candidate division WOR-3 bacterium]|nr:hypothetical protein [candidate division WOR-3 bacterium]